MAGEDFNKEVTLGNIKEPSRCILVGNSIPGRKYMQRPSDSSIPDLFEAERATQGGWSSMRERRELGQMRPEREQGPQL